MLQMSESLFADSIYCDIFPHSMTALHYIPFQRLKRHQHPFPGPKSVQSKPMETTASASNRDTWQPAWERQPEFSALLRPYSTASVVRDGERSQPELWDICNGCILWLPPKAAVGEIQDPNLACQDSGFFNHPVLILNIDVTGPRSATVQFAKMTSQRGRPLSEIPSHRQVQYLPIFPSSPHPHSGILLHLENEAPKRGMLQTSYVSIHEGVFSLDYRALRCYSPGQKADGYRHRLKEQSFNEVMRNIGRSPSAWIETGRLWEHFLQNHVPTGDGVTV